MSKVVIDASTLLAALLSEPARELAGIITDASMSAVNMAEVRTKLNDLRRLHLDLIHTQLIKSVHVVAFDEEQANLSATLRPSTRHAGLSLGDRACLALAIKLGAEVYTADRNWLKVEVGCKVNLIR